MTGLFWYSGGFFTGLIAMSMIHEKSFFNLRLELKAAKLREQEWREKLIKELNK